ncbi:hypothetical protein NXH76_02610 [Blautia schinkii]|nr:hypothetical protein [Blautia schinkii]
MEIVRWERILMFMRETKLDSLTIASGIPHEQLEIAFRKGINKFNVGTEFLGANYDAVAEYVHMLERNDKPLKMLEVPMFGQERLCGYLEEKLKMSRF